MDYTPTPKLPDFFAPKPTSGALTYTPTTEEVYRRFWRGTPLRSEDKLREYVALDRWLAEVKAQAVADWRAEQDAKFNKLTVDTLRQGEEQ